MLTKPPSPKFRFSAITMLLTDYLNRFSELKPKQEIFRYYERALMLVSVPEEIVVDCNGIILSWNSSYAEATHYGKNEIIGQHISLLYLPEDRQLKKPEELLKSAMLRGVATYYGRFVSREGIPLRGSMKVVTIKKKHVALGFTVALRLSTKK